MTRTSSPSTGTCQQPSTSSPMFVYGLGESVDFWRRDRQVVFLPSRPLLYYGINRCQDRDKHKWHATKRAILKIGRTRKEAIHHQALGTYCVFAGATAREAATRFLASWRLFRRTGTTDLVFCTCSAGEARRISMWQGLLR